jgi:putative transposase
MSSAVPDRIEKQILLRAPLARVWQALTDSTEFGAWFGVKLDGPFRTVDELELATLSWVHWFNEQRLHSAIDYLSPVEYERDYYRQINPQPQPRPGQLTLY